MNRFLLPFGIFLVLAAFLWIGLGLNPREVPSPLIDKPAPNFRLPQLHEPAVSLAPQDLRGKVWIFNVWASWCVACLEEHPLMVELSKRDDALAWLRKHGNPYTLSARDAEGAVGIDYGVYGVPESYVIDKDGVIRYKRIGPVTPQVLEQEILPLVKRLQG
jgi:cytochrome c biogenesis protein CcmG/thiol:disulfide interchange protein DsbE